MYSPMMNSIRASPTPSLGRKEVLNATGNGGAAGVAGPACGRTGSTGLSTAGVAGRAWASAPASCPSCFRTSSFRIRPSLPVAGIVRGSIPCCSIIRRTAGLSGAAGPPAAMPGWVAGSPPFAGVGDSPALTAVAVGSVARRPRRIDRRDDVADHDPIARLLRVVQHATLFRRDLDRGFVGLEGRDRFVHAHGLAVLLEPFDQHGLGNRLGESRDLDVDAHRPAVRRSNVGSGVPTASGGPKARSRIARSCSTWRW